ncbi:MAG TPA: EAL domain-containing protein [Arenimonas sp.]|nr:EAL domain-containing protein [Arenimonas sp.]
MIGISIAALFGLAALCASVLWFLWRESVAAEEAHVGGLASRLGARTEAIILDVRNLLRDFDAAEEARCSPEHLARLQEAAISRPWLRAIGHWRADQRLCGVGFLHGRALKPPRADRIYDSGVIAWWPSEHTEVGGVQLFIIRFGDHDAAIDPRMLLELDPLGGRQAGLWVEGLRLAAQPWDAELPAPESLPVGLSVDTEREVVMSRFSHHDVLPVDVVAVEPLARFWDRYLRTLAIGSGIGTLLVGAWLYALMRYTRHRLSMATQLRHALASGRIRARYQPVVELDSGRCVGAEALARWTMEGGEMVPPDTFIPIAESAGLVHEVTLAVLQSLLQELGDLLRRRPDLSINLNLCPEDLKTPHFDQQLIAALARAGLENGAIKLEITERALVNTDTARDMIRRFRERGHQIAVDDFGTGYSSLSYLASFDLDVLKIDKSFVDAIGTGSATSHVIVHVIEMANSLGLRTVAEGVQTPEQVEWLRAHGVHYGQGYLYSPPLGAQDFIDFVAGGDVP